MEEELEACRICLNCYHLTEMDFIYIFHKNEEFQHELDFIQAYIQQWQLKIQPDDGFPQRICADCFAKFCSIDAFRKECEMAQEKLLQTFKNAGIQQEQDLATTMLDKMKQESLLIDAKYPENDAAMPMMSSGETDHQEDLVASVSLAQNDVVLNDFRVFDQQFDHFDNPTLMDSAATLLDNNLIASETANEMGFLPSQNLFTFETAEPPTATLPLDETENPTSIMGEIMNVQSSAGGNEEQLVKHDLEDMLRRSIIPTNTTSTTTTNQKSAKMTVTTRTTTVDTAPTIIKTEVNGTIAAFKDTSLSNNNTNVTQTVQQTAQSREEHPSDNECDDTDVNRRLKGLPYTCHYCYCPDSGPIDHLSFPDEDALSQHFFDIHDPNRPYICPQCDNSYKTQKLRDNHVRLIHENTKTQKCNFCQKNLRGAIEIHQYHCQHIGDWECSQCKEKFPNTPLYRFRLHQRQHERGKHYKCSICDRTFMRKANLEAHEKLHKKSQWHCQICKTNFSTNYDLRRHNYQHHDDESPVKCKECNQGFSSIAFLQRHTMQIHSVQNSNLTTSSNVHICLKCNATFMSLATLQKHMDMADSNNGQCSQTGFYDMKERRRIQRQGVFPCFLCPKRFHLRSQLDKHLNTHDARLRPFQCEQCYVRCRTAIELKQHVDVAHLNIKAYACEKCGKSFGYKKDLRDHMLFHAEINVHCTEEGCEYVCKNEKALMDHIRHKHRLLSCEYCREEFTRQKMTAHLRNVHRAEIDVELAGESDNFYKSKLLNNNNDITQISFNLLNTQIASTANSTCTTTLTSACSSSSSIASSNPSPMSMSSTSNIHMTTAPTTTTTTASPPSPSTSSIQSHNNNNNNNHHQQQTHLQHQQYQAATLAASNNIFVTDHNSNNLALNGFISSPSPNELNLVSDDTTNANSNTLYMVSTASSSASPETQGHNDNNLDHFMASLMDTEQEITVT